MFDTTMWSCRRFIMSMALVIVGFGVSPFGFSCDHSDCQNRLPFCAGLS